MSVNIPEPEDYRTHVHPENNIAYHFEKSKHIFRTKIPNINSILCLTKKQVFDILVNVIEQIFANIHLDNGDI